MNPLKIIQKYYNSKSKLYQILIKHSMAVTKKALKIARKIKHLKPDLKFIKEASMLHDIGIFLTNAPEIECNGSKPYICHGYLGRKILEKEGLLKHGLVCERHLGGGITKKEIKQQDLPLPQRDMIPISIEEQIICFADKFFSKTQLSLQTQMNNEEKPLSEIKKYILKFGEDKVKKFEEWLKLFN